MSKTKWAIVIGVASLVVGTVGVTLSSVAIASP